MNSLEALEELQLNYEERTEILNNNMPSDWLSHTWLFNKIKKDLEKSKLLESKVNRLLELSHIGKPKPCEYKEYDALEFEIQALLGGESNEIKF